MIRFLTVSLVLALASAAGAQDALRQEPPAHAEDALQQPLDRVMHRWAEIKYELPASEQAAAYEALAAEAQRLTGQYPDRAEPKIWEAIVRASHAGAMGGIRSLFSALPEVKRARELLLAAERIDPRALDGSAYTSLGSLYDQVPGSPVGFGDPELARENLERALEISPDGIDANFFMGEHWAGRGDAARARRYLERALEAPPRPGRELADRGRREEIRTRLEQLEG